MQISATLWTHGALEELYIFYGFMTTLMVHVEWFVQCAQTVCSMDSNFSMIF